MTVFVLENWPSFCTYSHMLNSVILATQSKVIFRIRKTKVQFVNESLFDIFLYEKRLLICKVSLWLTSSYRAELGQIIRLFK